MKFIYSKRIKETRCLKIIKLSQLITVYKQFVCNTFCSTLFWGPLSIMVLNCYHIYMVLWGTFGIFH